MKEGIKRIFKKITTNNFGWKILKPLARLGNFLFLSRQIYLEKNITFEETSLVVNVLTDKFELITQEGPFKGLIYPSMKSVGSSLYPKLIGSYEKELWPIINEFKANQYMDIIDIGSAEGYYAVGLARIFKKAKIIAYDINNEARELCQEMAIKNQVGDRLKIYSYCSSEVLAKFNFQERGLIICDCEGFEKELFSKENINNLKGCDLIIETHDFIDINISSKIKELFKNTHDLISIKSIDDIEKAHTYNFKVLENFSLEDKLLYLSEYRPAIMEWVICKSKMKNI